jgi:RNA polymerase sigma factor (TIGR02999 family)
MMQLGQETRAGEVTRLLRVVRDGDRQAFDRLFALVYGELRRIAQRQLRGERDGGPLRPTELVNELYLKLADGSRPNWENRAHFFGIAAQAMRQLLVDLARRRRAAKRGGEWSPTTLTDNIAGAEVELDEVLALEDAVARLEPRQRRIVEYRFYGGLSEEEIAHLLGVSTRTVQREWIKARAWIYSALYGEGNEKA